jgi:hypothetical protein
MRNFLRDENDSKFPAVTIAVLITILELDTTGTSGRK